VHNVHLNHSKYVIFGERNGDSTKMNSTFSQALEKVWPSPTHKMGDNGDEEGIPCMFESCNIARGYRAEKQSV
jgi:hypothetical protein